MAKIARPRSFPVAEWPPADRTAWERALAPGKRWVRGGRASHLARASIDDIKGRYGAYLAFLQRKGLLDQNGCASTLVTEKSVAEYLAELQSRVRSMTVYNCIRKLHWAAMLLSSEEADFSWLKEIESGVGMVAEPQSKFARTVTANRLVEAGLALIAKARAQSLLEQARTYRNGLMIALLALCPIRLKNFAALEIGETFQRVDGSWWIMLDRHVTKSKRRDERRIPQLLYPMIAEYVDRQRPILLDGASTDALWISSTKKRRLTPKNLATLISKLTKAEIGVDVSPHLFRTAAASTVANEAPPSPGLASAVLGHLHSSFTEIYYNRAKTYNAAMAYAEALKQIIEAADS